MISSISISVVNVNRSFGCNFCINSSDCVASSFLYDCRNCADCFGGVNLRNARYIFFGEQLSKEEYFCKLLEVDFGSYKVLEEYRTRFAELVQKAVHKNVDNVKVHDVVGNGVRECNNAYNSFDIVSGENMRHTTMLTIDGRDMMDFYGGGSIELMYESSAAVDSASIIGCILIRTGQNVEYSQECSNVQNVFGCAGLKNKKFCIFNKQYSEEEYWSKVDELKAAMLLGGEYGEVFSITSSPIAYNDSSASIEFLLTKEEASTRGYPWYEEDTIGPKVDQKAVVQAADLPDNIRDIDDDILTKAIVCAKSKRPFRINKEELAFYRQHKFALPRLHPDVRILKLLEHRIPYRLWDDVCKKCGKEIRSGYDPEKGYKVYCESCYQQEVI